MSSWGEVVGCIQSVVTDLSTDGIANNKRDGLAKKAADAYKGFIGNSNVTNENKITVMNVMRTATFSFTDQEKEATGLDYSTVSEAVFAVRIESLRNASPDEVKAQIGDLIGEVLCMNEKQSGSSDWVVNVNNLVLKLNQIINSLGDEDFAEKNQIIAGIRKLIDDLKSKSGDNLKSKSGDNLIPSNNLFRVVCNSPLIVQLGFLRALHRKYQWKKITTDFVIDFAFNVFKDKKGVDSNHVCQIFMGSLDKLVKNSDNDFKSGKEFLKFFANLVLEKTEKSMYMNDIDVLIKLNLIDVIGADKFNDLINKAMVEILKNGKNLTNGFNKLRQLIIDKDGKLKFNGLDNNNKDLLGEPIKNGTELAKRIGQYGGPDLKEAYPNDKEHKEKKDIVNRGGILNDGNGYTVIQ